MAAASDLLPLERELAAAAGASAGVTLRFTFAGSGVLARQIQNGAPFDVFLSANEAYVRELEGRGKVVAGSAVVYAAGRLGLWSKDGRVKSLQGLAGARVVHVALPNPAHAPYGAAAREMLRRLGLWEKLEPKLVYGENVQQALQYAESGNADACLTAWSLLRTHPGAVRLDAELHPPIRQVGAVVAGRPHGAAAAAVLRYLVSPAGQALLGRWGFSGR